MLQRNLIVTFVFIDAFEVQISAGGRVFQTCFADV